jgi:hypothetical protein
MDASLRAPSQPANARSATWFETFKREGFYLKYSAIATLIAGMYLHITGLFIGRELLLQYVFTPWFDAALALPMTYTAVAGWLSWRKVDHRGMAHAIIYTLVCLYMTISVPLHIQTYLTWSTEWLRFISERSTLIVLPWQLFLIVFVWRLRFKQTTY